MAKRKKRSKKTSPKRFAWRFYLFHFTLWGVAAFIGYWMWLDHYVGRTFDTQVWSLPAKIFADPVEFYTGARLDPAEIKRTLEQLGYEQVHAPADAGEFSVVASSYKISTRGFEFPDSPEPPRRISFQLRNGVVEQLRGNDQNKDIAIARLEPIEIGQVHARTFEDREIVDLKDFPDGGLQLLVAVEDRRFFSHVGIDPLGVVRALWTNLRAGRIVQGGSTLTQQLIKNMYLTSTQSLARKVREAMMAISLERRVGKNQILRAYVNEIFLGQDGERAIHGFGLAAKYFFGKPLSKLDISEISLLIGMIKAPSAYHPGRNPDGASQRRETVLEIALAHDLIDRTTFEAASTAPIDLRTSRPIKTKTFKPFIDVVKAQLTRDYRRQDLYGAGLRIFTTLDPWAQEITQRSVDTGLVEIEESRSAERNSLQAALVLITPGTGEIRALVGGRGNSSNDYNRAISARRPIGSLIKPLVYLLALKRRTEFNVLSTLADEPVSVPTDNGQLWSPKNYDGIHHGDVSLRQAFAKSYNLATVNLGLHLGVGEVASELAATGIVKEVPEYPSLLLGAIDLSPLDVAQLYQAFANEGFQIPLKTIRAVISKNGKVLSRYPTEVVQRFDPDTAYLLEYLMIGAVEHGTARRAATRLSSQLPLAGKTGTSNDGRDSWFAGYGEQDLAVVWVGRDDNGVAGLSGATGALPIWIDAMRQVRVAPIVPGPTSALTWEWVSPTGQELMAENCEGAVRVPLAMPHGLSPSATCRRSDVETTPLWQKFKGLFN